MPKTPFSSASNSHKATDPSTRPRYNTYQESPASTQTAPYRKIRPSAATHRNHQACRTLCTGTCPLLAPMVHSTINHCTWFGRPLLVPLIPTRQEVKDNSIGWYQTEQQVIGDIRQERTPYSSIPLPHVEQNSRYSVVPEPLSLTCSFVLPAVTLKAPTGILAVRPNSVPKKRCE